MKYLSTMACIFSIVLLATIANISYAAISTSQQAVVEGVVVDRDGNPLAKVQILFIDRDRGTKFTMRSGRDGKFMKVGIPPSRYVITVELEGYFPLESEFRVQIGRNRGLKLILEKKPEKVEEDPDIQAGAQLFQAGQYEEAITKFQAVVERDFDNVTALYSLALSLLRVGRIDDAIAYFEKAKTLQPDMLEIYLGLGECYFSQEKNDLALSTFNQAVELDPGNAEVHYNIGIIYYKTDQTDKAIQHFITSKSLDPEFAPTYYQLGLAFLKRGDTNQAIENLEQYLVLEPDSPQAPQVRAIIDQLKK